ncbi:MAG TPA: hypothetical protein VG146_07600 [Verrucomicrobiae bacterium]|nr:hypothetical protein [Verrucomicrobiae bacterium]
MKERHSTKERGTITGIAETTAERVRSICEDLKAQAVAKNEQTQRKFRYAVLVRLSRIETIVHMIHGAQIVEAQGLRPGYEERAREAVGNAERYVSQHTHDLYMNMVSFIYGKEAEPVASRDRRQKWSGWEI